MLKSIRGNLDQFDHTVDSIVNQVINKASNRQEVKEDVGLSIQTAFLDVIASHMQPNDETGFAFLEYDNVELYQGPSRLMDLVNPDALDTSVESKQDSNKKSPKTVKNDMSDSTKHGEIIIRVHKGQKVTVRADENNDTIIANIQKGEVIIRNVDTNLLLTVSKGNIINQEIELCIVGQAYIKDICGDIKASQFQGIVVVRNDLS